MTIKMNGTIDKQNGKEVRFLVSVLRFDCLNGVDGFVDLAQKLFTLFTFKPSALRFAAGISVGRRKQQQCSASKSHYRSVVLQGSFGSRWRPLNWLTHRAFQSSGCLDERAQRKNLEESIRLRGRRRVGLEATDHRLQALMCPGACLLGILA